MIRGGVRSLSLVETPCLLETFSFLFFFLSLFHSCFLFSLSILWCSDDGWKKITRYVYRGERGARIHLANLFRRQA